MENLSGDLSAEISDEGRSLKDEDGWMMENDKCKMGILHSCNFSIFQFFNLAIL